MHCITYVLEKKNSEIVVVVKHTLRQSRFTLSQALVFSLSALYFKLNFLCESSDDFLFLDANADWYMLKSKWNSQKTILHQDNSRTTVGSRRVLACTFAPPRNVHATREEILSAGKPMRSKNNFRGITMGRGPIWGSNSLCFLCSCRNTVSTKKQPTFSLFRLERDMNIIWTRKRSF